MAVEVIEMERWVALALTESERAALLRVLYVVKDFWLDEVEESLLERLLEVDRGAYGFGRAPTAARTAGKGGGPRVANPTLVDEVLVPASAVRRVGTP